MLVRPATPDDVPVLNVLIARSARELSRGFYDEQEIASAIKYVFGVDTTLIADRTYFVVVDGELVLGCGGWSRRRALYGGDQRPVGSVEDFLDPHCDAARIRAFFVAPEAARRGVGRQLLDACTRAAQDAGFTRLELMATLPGVPFYRTQGFVDLEAVTDTLPDGVPLRFIRMSRTLLPPDDARAQ